MIINCRNLVVFAIWIACSTGGPTYANEILSKGLETEKGLVVDYLKLHERLVKDSDKLYRTYNPEYVHLVQLLLESRCIKIPKQELFESEGHFRDIYAKKLSELEDANDRFDETSTTTEFERASSIKSNSLAYALAVFSMACDSVDRIKLKAAMDSPETIDDPYFKEIGMTASDLKQVYLNEYKNSGFITMDEGAIRNFIEIEEKMLEINSPSSLEEVSEMLTFTPETIQLRNLDTIGVDPIGTRYQNGTFNSVMSLHKDRVSGTYVILEQLDLSKGDIKSYNVSPPNYRIGQKEILVFVHRASESGRYETIATWDDMNKQISYTLRLDRNINNPDENTARALLHDIGSTL